MSVLPINLYGDKILREKVKKVEKIDDEIIEIVTDMFETMRNANGGIGLAANQVGINKKIFVLDLSPIEEYKDHKPMVVINPEIVEFSDDLEVMEEGCLSLPGLYAEVERPAKIKLKYMDLSENEQIIEADGFFARAIQHEYDHLIGKMIPDHLESDDKKKIQVNLNKIMNRTLEISYPVSQK